MMIYNIKIGSIPTRTWHYSSKREMTVHVFEIQTWTYLPLTRGPQQWVLNILAEDCLKEELQVTGNEWFLLGYLEIILKYTTFENQNTSLGLIHLSIEEGSPRLLKLIRSL